MKRPRGKAGNQRADEKKHAQTDQTSDCRDKDRRKFQLPRRLDHADTITTRPKKIEQTSTKWNLVIPSISRGIPMRNLKGNDFSTCAQ